MLPAPSGEEQLCLHLPRKMNSKPICICYESKINSKLNVLSLSVMPFGRTVSFIASLRDCYSTDSRCRANIISEDCPNFVPKRHSEVNFSVLGPFRLFNHGFGLVTLFYVRSFGVHAEGIVLCNRACFCLPSTFFDTQNPSKNLCPYGKPLAETHTRCLLRDNYLRILLLKKRVVV